MNLLTDALPLTVEVAGREYPIDSSYRCMVRFELLIRSRTVGEAEKAVRSLQSFYPQEMPGDLQAAMDRLLWFYRCGKKERPQRASSMVSQRGAAQEIYSFEYDDDYLYAAFLDQYGLDLQEHPDLHWWKFKAMFKALRQENEIVKIMGYRGMTIDSSMTDGQKRFYAKMKDVHRLPLSEDEEQQLRTLERILMGDGKLPPDA